jgi:hypothetical protein
MDTERVPHVCSKPVAACFKKKGLWLPFSQKKSLWLPASCNFGPELYCLMQIQMRKVVDEVN